MRTVTSPLSAYDNAARFLPWIAWLKTYDIRLYLMVGRIKTLH